MSRLHLNVYSDGAKTPLGRCGSRVLEAVMMFNFDGGCKSFDEFRVRMTADDEHVKLSVVAPGGGSPISTVIFERETQMSFSYQGDVSWVPEPVMNYDEP